MELEIMKVVEQMKLQSAESNYLLAIQRAHIAALEAALAAVRKSPDGPIAESQS